MISLATQAQTDAVTGILKNRSSINVSVGCEIEYNMNTMIDNISVYSSNTDAEYTAGITDFKQGSANPFKKLFPVDSIIKPFRPLNSGVKYFVVPPDGTNFIYKDPKATYYNLSTPRVYYPGPSTFYKYWLSPEGKDSTITIKYSQTTVAIVKAEASNTGTRYKVKYTTTVPHGFVTGNTITITGMSDTAYNTNGKIIEVPSSTSFIIEKNIGKIGYLTSAGVATIPETKAAIANKILIRFDKNHALPSEVTVSITYKDGTVKSGIMPNFSTDFLSGEISLYPTEADTNWIHFTDNIYRAPKYIKSIALTAKNPGGTSVMGLIEISARWVKEISPLVAGFSLSQESSNSSSSDILPVGKLSANVLSLSLSNYNQNQVMIRSYNREKPWTTIANGPSDFDFLYTFKNAELRPHFKIYDGSTEYKIPQGSYYMDSWTINNFGDTDIVALDGAKYLMESIAPDMLCETYSATAIIRRLLDSVGFTNYNINMVTETSAKGAVIIKDTSIPTIGYWWTTDSKTVWEHLQDLCRDIQMNAFFDQNNVLQFYTRDKIYSQTTPVWNFYEKPEGSVLPNIISLSQEEVASGNNVKIIWNSIVPTQYTGDATKLAQAPTTFLSAGGLKLDISKDTPADNTVLVINNNTVGDSYSQYQSGFAFSGYFLIDSEVIEFDALEYQFIDFNDDENIVWIASQNDVNKYVSLSKPGFVDINNILGTAYFKPTGRYRVKTRGALGTVAADHKATPMNVIESGGWTERVVEWI